MQHDIVTYDSFDLSGVKGQISQITLTATISDLSGLTVLLPWRLPITTRNCRAALCCLGRIRPSRRTTLHCFNCLRNNHRIKTETPISAVSSWTMVRRRRRTSSGFLRRRRSAARFLSILTPACLESLLPPPADWARFHLGSQRVGMRSISSMELAPSLESKGISTPPFKSAPSPSRRRSPWG